MQYRKNIKNGDMLSALGYGTMRLPSKNGNKRELDREESIRVLRLAHDLGINYFDTAYIYNDGLSEEILGEAVKPFRNEVKIATKLPLRGIRSRGDFDKYFYKSLERLGTNYIDYYLIHNIISYDQFQYIIGLGLFDWIKEKKDKGEIINIGFSTHANLEDIKKVIDGYDWEFCQFQYNYVDIAFQAGIEGVKYANKKGLPIIIMEPLRGGALVNKIPSEAEKAFRKVNPTRTNADWGLRWIYNQPEITVVLSGMGSEEMLKTNVETASSAEAGHLSQEELAVYDVVRNAINSEDNIPCTGCYYCMPCPKGVNIPVNFNCYNSKKLTGYGQSLLNYVSSTGALTDKPGFASQCVGCGMCEKKCPQGIKIREELIKVKKRFEIPGIHGIVKIAKKVVKL